MIETRLFVRAMRRAHRADGRCLATLVLVLATTMAPAQSSTKRPSEIPLTAESAAEVALSRSSALKAARARTSADEAAAYAEGLPENPRLAGAYKAGSGVGRTELALTFDLWSLIGAGARRRASDAEHDRAEAALAEDALALVADAKAALYAVQAASATWRLRRDAADEERVSADAAKGPALERDSARAASAETSLDADRAEAGLQEARSALARLMHAPRESGWWTEAVLPEPLARDPDPGALAGLATERRPARGAALAAARAAEQRARAWNSSNSGPLRLGAAAERQPDGTRLAGPAFELDLPAFDPSRPGARAARARADEAQALAEEEEADLTAELETLEARLAAARKTAARLGADLVPARARIAAETRRSSDRRAETDARVALIEALREYWTTRAALERAVGGSLP